MKSYENLGNVISRAEQRKIVGGLVNECPHGQVLATCRVDLNEGHGWIFHSCTVACYDPEALPSYCVVGGDLCLS